MEIEDIYSKFLNGNKNVIIVTLLLNEEPIDVTDNLNSLVIHRYNNTYKTIYSLDLNLPTDTLEKINKSKNWKVSLNIYTDNEYNNIEPLNIEALSLKRLLQRNLMLQPFKFDKDISSESISNRTESNKDDMTHNYKTMNLKLECFEFVSFFSDLVLNNYCYNNVTMQDVIYDLILKSKMNLKAVNISKIDNTKTYEQVFIPPMTLFNALSYLNDNYSIFNTNAKFFLDNERLFVKKENVIINNKTGKDVFNIIVEDVFNNKYETYGNTGDYIYSIPVLIENNSDVKMKNSSSKVIFTNKDNEDFKKYSNVDYKSKLEQFSTNKQHQKETVISNNLSNKKFALENMEYKQLCNVITTSINLLNVPISYINFTTSFNISFMNKEQKKYSGIYHIIDSVISYTRSEADFSCQTYLSLKKSI